MPAQANRMTKQSRGLNAAGLIAVTAATLLMTTWAVLPPTLAQADPPGKLRVVDGHRDDAGPSSRSVGDRT